MSIAGLRGSRQSGGRIEGARLGWDAAARARGGAGGGAPAVFRGCFAVCGWRLCGWRFAVRIGDQLAVQRRGRSARRGAGRGRSGDQPPTPQRASQRASGRAGYATKRRRRSAPQAPRTRRGGGRGDSRGDPHLPTRAGRRAGEALPPKAVSKKAARAAAVPHVWDWQGPAAASFRSLIQRQACQHQEA